MGYPSGTVGTVANTIIQADLAAILSAEPAMHQLAGAHLFITGGTGFIGRWLLESLALFNDTTPTPCQVTLLTRSRARFTQTAAHLAQRPDFRIVEGDVADFQGLERNDVQFVIHAATDASPYSAETNPTGIIRTIVHGTERVLDWATRQPLRAMVYVSSGAIYGTQPPHLECLPETYEGGPSPARSGAAYAEAKRLAETLCSIAAERQRIPLSIARLFTFVGPFQSLDSGFAVTDFCRDGLAGRPLQINGDGTAVRSYCYGADMAIWLWAMLLRGQRGTVYNLGSDHPLSIRALAEHVVRALARQGINTEYSIARQPRTEQVPARYVPETQRARTDLHLTLSTSLDDALERTLIWHRQRTNSNPTSRQA